VSSVGHVMIGVGNGSETFVAQTVRETDRRGWRAFVLAVNRAGRFDAIPSQRIHVTEPAPLARRAFDKLARRPPQRRFSERAAQPARKWGLELLHAHFGWSAGYALPLSRALGLPLVVTFYGSDASAPPVDRYRPVLEHAARVIAVSEYVGERLRALGFTGPIELIRNGVNLTKLTPRTQAPAVKKLVFVGRMVAVKGADVLLRAMPEILARHPDATLELIGDGEALEALRRLAVDLRIMNAVEFRGARDHEYALRAITEASAVVVPSRMLPSGQAESSSMAFKEALALGVPVVATSSGGLPETCPPPLRSELAVPGDPRSLAASALRILDAPDLDRRAAIGRAWVSERFNSDVVTEQLLDTYAQAVRG
jgi:colanic acid/amylovoran biosynthesis glycosyltransferase